MTRKDYVAFAEVIGRVGSSFPRQTAPHAAARAALSMLASEMMQIFRADNSSFNPTKFLSALESAKAK